MKQYNTSMAFLLKNNSLMHTLVFALLSINVLVSSIRIPFIDNAILVPVSISTSTVIQNLTCDQCLCNATSSKLALNCFPNDTCQMFTNVPRTYTIETVANGRLYFPQQILPNASQCCMPDLDEVLSKLQNATPIYVSMNSPRCLAFDNQGYVASIDSTAKHLKVFDATNLTLMLQSSNLSTSTLTNMAYYDGNYYVGTSANTILIINASNLTIINTINSANLSGPRDMTFMNNGSIMIAASTNNNKLLIFNRTSVAPLSYSFAYQLPVSYAYPHGILRINDSFLYVTSWFNNTVYSYNALNLYNKSWTETFDFSAIPVAPSSSGNHILIDECDRRWYSLGNYGIKIFNSSGSPIGSFSLANLSVFDTLLTDNYVIYLSDTLSNRIIRIDPNMDCQY
ncbi:unnamed protein product [Rotaria magnacalcarata]|uniref:Uncharacterized protein n=2 Tax=Rotaria magnacalcarata TaxID=392030 RepID=A0A819UZY1_9BILA|nr:unnamed protein product [Rotaria magnacalcarata]CAF3976415.1 unnamed protein product [Rotaria magnacalcarata]CAF4103523.1 unnamed protein product [Rotaria magnacalcarata]